MRLSDHIIAEVGGPDDIGGLFTSTAAAIREAERFELTDDVSRAAYNLTRLKPSSLLKTMPLCRAPYRKMWFEWRGGLTSSLIRPEHKRDPRTHPDPIKQGVLIETDETGQRGSMTFAWMHDHRLRKSSGVSINPLGTLFNWHEDGNVHDDLRRVIQGRYPTKPPLDMIAGASLDVLCAGSYQRTLSDEDAKAWMAGSSFKLWATWANNESERRALQTLHQHAMPFFPSHCLGFLNWCATLAHQNNKMDAFLTDILTNWKHDIEGEPPFAETIIGLMNSRNAVEHRPVDLTALNKQRTKRGRPTFLPYRTTHLRLTQAQTRALRDGVMSRQEAGQHTVRGHFKVRKHGIYWWTPFYRGDPTRPLHRQEYEVD
jgi:hypothetical protein